MDDYLSYALIGFGVLVVGILVAAWWALRPKPFKDEQPEEYLTIWVTRGKRGKWRWVLRNEQGGVVAVSSPQGYDDQATARTEAMRLCVRQYRVTFAEVKDHTFEDQTFKEVTP